MKTSIVTAVGLAGAPAAFRHTVRILALAAASLGVAGAASIPVLNFSFENTAVSLGGFTTFGVPNWAGGAAIWGVYRPRIGADVIDVPDGVQVGFLYGPGYMYQDLGVTVQSDTTYQLDVWAGMQVGFPVSYEVQLLAGGTTVIANATGSQSIIQPMQHLSISGVGAGSGALGVKLISLGGQPLFDFVQVSSSQAQTGAPEPGTLSALGAGLAILWWRRRRR